MAAYERTTIAAVSSPPGGAERAVLRISGPDARAVVIAGFTPTAGAFDPNTRSALLGRFDDGRGEQPALLLWMPAPHSYTREDVAELHLPGAPPLVERALERLVELGCQPAQPGEFTRRAFLNGRLDLTRAEGVLTLVSASDDGERRAAGALLFGGLEQRVAALRERLDTLRALCEASLDFDERDTGHVDEDELLRAARAALAALVEARGFEQRREPLSGIPRVVLAGAPNAGKSTLFNRLTGGNALVSRHPGTTRDPLRGIWHLGGAHDVQLFDTAGLDAPAPAGEVERRAADHARAVLDAADLVLWLARVDAPVPPGPHVSRSVLRVLTQIDRGPGPLGFTPDASVSAHSGAGLSELERAVARALGLTAAPAPSGAGAVGRELGVRHRRALRAAETELETACELLAERAPLDLAAEALRAATSALDEISGRTTPEDLLDKIFARFCLGK